MALAILAAVAITAAITFRDYGLGWDDYTHSEYGDLLLTLGHDAGGAADRRDNRGGRPATGRPHPL
jgi:hypothetical protein